MRENMPCWTKIYAIFWDHHRACFPGKKSKAQKHIQIFSMLRPGFFFPQNTLGDGPAFWIFFQESRIRVNRVKCPHFDRVFPGLTAPCQNVKCRILWSDRNMYFKLLIIEPGKCGRCITERPWSPSKDKSIWSNISISYWMNLYFGESYG